MIYKILRNTTLFIIIFLLFISSSYALGVGLGPKIMFEPNKIIEEKMCVINEANNDKVVELAVTEDEFGMYRYVELEEKEIKVKAKSNTCVDYTVNFPSKWPKYGRSRIYITATEKAPRGVGIKVRVSMRYYFTVLVPYPGTYLQGKMITQDIDMNQTEQITINLQSMGEDLIEVIKGKVKIIDSNNNSLVILNTTKAYNLESKKKISLFADWDSNGNKQGEYIAKATIHYGNKTLELKEKFHIGALNVEILEFTKEVEADKINKFEIYAKSQWNKNIDNVYATVSMGNNQEFITPSTTLEPWKKTKLVGYWDTTGMSPGSYNAFIKVYYGDKESTLNGQVKVIPKKSDQIEIKEIKEEKPKEEMPVNAIVVLLIALILILLIANFFWIIMSFKKNKKQKTKSEKNEPPRTKVRGI